MTALFFSTGWCPDCVRARRLLQRLGVSFTEYDVEESKDADAKMRSLNGGSGKVPTVVIESDSERIVLIEPSVRELTDAICAHRGDAD